MVAVDPDAESTLEHACTDDDGTTLAELIEAAIRDHQLEDDPASEAAYDQFLVTAGRLRDRGPVAVDAVEALFCRGDRVQRAAAVDLFGRLAFDATVEIREPCLTALQAAMGSELGGESDEQVLNCLASSFGHLGDPRGVPSLVRLVRHPSEEIRHTVAFSLPSAASFVASAEVVDALIELSADTHGVVRDWACFGLGQLDVDRTDLREAMAARLDDSHIEARCEALLTLAQLGDVRAKDVLTARLYAVDELWRVEIMAAAAYGNVEWQSHLRELRDEWEDDDDFGGFQEVLDLAIRRCDPDGHERARQFETEFLIRLRAAFAGVAAIELRGTYPYSRIVAVDGRDRVRLDESLWRREELPEGRILDVDVMAWMKTIADAVASTSAE